MSLVFVSFFQNFRAYIGHELIPVPKWNQIDPNRVIFGPAIPELPKNIEFQKAKNVAEGYYKIGIDRL